MMSSPRPSEHYNSHQVMPTAGSLPRVLDNRSSETTSMAILTALSLVALSMTVLTWVNDAEQRQLKLVAELTQTLVKAKQAHLQSTLLKIL